VEFFDALDYRPIAIGVRYNADGREQRRERRWTG